MKHSLKDVDLTDKELLDKVNDEPPKKLKRTRRSSTLIDMDNALDNMIKSDKVKNKDSLIEFKQNLENLSEKEQNEGKTKRKRSKKEN